MHVVQQEANDITFVLLPIQMIASLPMYKPQCRKHKYTSASPTIRGIYTD